MDRVKDEPKPVKILEKADRDRLRTRAILCQIYHNAIHEPRRVVRGQGPDAHLPPP